MAALSALNALQNLGKIIKLFKNTADALEKEKESIKSVKDFTAWLKKKINPFVADVGMIFYKKTLGKKLKISDAMTLITKSVSLVDNALAIAEENGKANPSSTVIKSKIAAIVSDITAITKPLAKLGGKDLWFLSIASAGISAVSNYIATTDGINDKEKTSLNKSYLTFLNSIDKEATKKIFDEALTAEIKSASKKDLDEVLKNGKLIKKLGGKITAPGGPLDLIFSFATGIFNGIDKYKSNLQKYTDDGIPEKIGKHDAVVDAIATIIHDTLSGFVKGADDVVFDFVQKIFRDEENIDENKTYVDAIADLFKKLNPKNSGTSGDDKIIYLFENKSMVYGDGGNDSIENYGFSNVTIWGGHDNDTIKSYKTDTATPQKNSIFGGTGDDKLYIYDKNSSVYGGAGIDGVYVVGTKNKIYGDAGNDAIYLDGADNTASGGAGNDIIVAAKNTLIEYTKGDGTDTIYNMDADDNLKISGSYKTAVSGNDVKITIGKGSILLVGMAGKDFKINGKTITRGKEDPTASITVPGFPYLPAIVESPIICGTEGNDYFFNYRHDVIIFALGGNDVIKNMHGSNTLIGGAGNDSIYNAYNAYRSLIDGSEGSDVICNDGDNVTIAGGDNNDSINNGGQWDGNWHSGGSNVMINGSTGDDDVWNYEHNVTIDGGAGNDFIGNSYYRADFVSINGGSGDDVISNIANNLTIIGGKGNDSISNEYNQSANVLFKYANGDGFDIIEGFNSTSTLNITADKYSTKKSGSDVIVTVGDGKITLVGAANLDKVNVDFTKVLTVTDKTKSPVTADSKTKIIDASTRTKAVNITGNKLANTISGGAKNDSLYGGNGNDSIVGNAGNDKIYGGKGNDTLLGGAGNDSLWGEAGADTFLYSKGDGKDIIYGFDSKDTLTLDGLDFKATYKNSAVTLKFDGGSVTLKDFTTKTFHINNDIYKISGSKFVKR